VGAVPRRAGDFDGAEFRTPERDGSRPAHAFGGVGSAVCFVSHKYHCVAPVTRGRRNVLILEFWQGEERRCAHRCTQHFGECGFERAQRLAAMPAAGAAGAAKAKVGAGAEGGRGQEEEEEEEQGADSDSSEGTDPDEPPLSCAEVAEQAQELFEPCCAMALYSRICSLPHGPEPNCEVRFNSGGGAAGSSACAGLYALRDIEKGEALTIADPRDEDEGYDDEEEDDDDDDGQEDEEALLSPQSDDDEEDDEEDDGEGLVIGSWT
jgi:hypothetical protein